MQLPLRSLGQSDIQITPIGLGVWQFSEGKGFSGLVWNAITGEETTAIVQAALDGGINWFDTAEIYGNGRSEQALARALQQTGRQNGQVVVATKWHPLLRRASSIGRTIDQRLSNLAPYAIDLHQVHSPASLSSPEAEMDAMADLLAAGQIRSVGVSNFSAQLMTRAHDRLYKRGYFLAANQVKYSLLDRRIEHNGVLTAAKKLGITIIAYSPLEMGLLSGKFHRNPELLNGRPRLRRLQLQRQIESSRPLITALEEIAARHSVSVSQVALNWLITFHGDVVVAIPGASKARHAQENAGAMAFTLSDEELARLDVLSRPRVN
jgi:aryl-alcohol dehydrogenase-like predicted oxidoreductase